MKLIFHQCTYSYYKYLLIGHYIENGKSIKEIDNSGDRNSCDLSWIDLNYSLREN